MMIDRLKNLALKKAYHVARMKGVDCPQCQQTLDLPREMPEPVLEADFRCRQCGWSGTLQDSFGDAEQRPTVLAQPSGSKIVHKQDGQKESWWVPAKKRPNFFWFFSGFWLAITGFMTFMFLFGDVTDSETGEPASRWIALFFVPFWAVGLGTLYVGLRWSFREYIITVDAEKVSLLEKCFGKVKLKSVAREHVKRVYLSESHKQNERRVYQVEVVASEGKNLKFGSGMKSKEKAWMVSELQRATGMQAPERADSRELTRDSRAVQDSELKPFDEKGLKLEAISQDSFRLTRVHKYGVWVLLGSVFLFVVSALLIGDALGEGLGGGDEPLWLKLIDLLFTALPMLFGLGAFCAGIGLACFGLKRLGMVEVFEFNDDQLIVKRGKRHYQAVAARHQRSDFESVKRSQAGHVNNDARYKVELRGKKKVVLAGFIPRSTATQLENWVLHWLQDDQSLDYGSAMDV